MNDQAEVTLNTIAKGVTTVSGGAAFIGGLSANDIAAFFGVLGVVAGLVMQLYFSVRRERREEAEHALRLSSYRERRDDPTE